ncbi:MAG: succinate dehydrogenase [Caldithrix sp.]|nr:succinate dehydrogenase [Caldithrix sp.]
MKISMSVFSTLGKKIFMGVTGLLLSGFIVIHLIGNLQLLLPDKDPFNIYAHILTQETGSIIYIAEFLLAAVFLIHFVYAIIVTWNNWQARPEGYRKVKWAKNTSRRSIGSVTMIYTGVVIMVFLVWHLLHFKFGEVVYYTPAGYDHEIRDLYVIVYQFFGNIINVILYIIVMALLGFHLSHGFWSAFQSLGLDGKRFTPFVYGLGVVFAIVMAVGFLFLPLFIFMTTGGTV